MACAYWNLYLALSFLFAFVSCALVSEIPLVFQPNYGFTTGRPDALGTPLHRGSEYNFVVRFANQIFMWMWISRLPIPNSN